MKAIIFGINGQDGYYLNYLLTREQIEVIGISRTGNFINGNVADLSFVEMIIRKHQPDFIFHFAANSTTQHEVLFENHETICTGTLNLLESVKKYCPKAKVFIAGSAMQFKNEGLPINEQTPFEAGSAYAVARIQSVFASRYYRNKFGIKVYIGYFFNHDSPKHSENHINQKITKAVQRIAQGSNETLELGNIEVKKEFGYAGDCVEAMWTLISQENIFEAVIGTGIAYSIKDWLVSCFESVGKNWQNHVIFIKDFVPEYQILVSNPQLINSLGWFPKTDFVHLSKMMMGDNYYGRNFRITLR